MPFNRCVDAELPQTSNSFLAAATGALVTMQHAML